MKKFMLSELKRQRGLAGLFDRSCTVEVTDETLDAIDTGKLRFSVARIGKKTKICNLNIVLRSTFGNIKLSIGNSNSCV